MAKCSMRPGAIRDAGAGGTPVRARRTRLMREPEGMSINRAPASRQIAGSGYFASARTDAGRSVSTSGPDSVIATVCSK